MIKKYSLLLFVCIFIFIFLSACIDTGISGIYVNSKKPDSYIEFRPDGRFFYHMGGMYGDEINVGNYETNGNNILLYYPSGITYEVTRDENSIHTRGLFGESEYIKVSYYDKSSKGGIVVSFD